MNEEKFKNWYWKFGIFFPYLLLEENQQTLKSQEVMFKQFAPEYAKVEGPYCLFDFNISFLACIFKFSWWLGVWQYLLAAFIYKILLAFTQNIHSHIHLFIRVQILKGCFYLH